MILCGMLDFCRLLFGIVIDLFRPRGPRPGRHRGRAFLQFLFMLERARRVRARRSAGTRRRGVLARGGLARARQTDNLLEMLVGPGGLEPPTRPL
jgi:hypothetical protein